MNGVELTAEELEVVSRDVAAGKSLRAIGRSLGRDHTVISREVKRNCGRGEYRAVAAQQRATRLRKRPKDHRLVTDRRLHDAVNEGLSKKWSPRQISKRLRTDFVDDDTMRVSHETIYQCLYLQAKGELRTELALAAQRPDPSGGPDPTSRGQGHDPEHDEHQRPAR